MDALVITFSNTAVFKNSDFFQASTFIQKMTVGDIDIEFLSIQFNWTIFTRVPNSEFTLFSGGNLKYNLILNTHFLKHYNYLLSSTGNEMPVLGEKWTCIFYMNFHIVYLEPQKWRCFFFRSLNFSLRNENGVRGCIENLLLHLL